MAFNFKKLCNELDIYSGLFLSILGIAFLLLYISFPNIYIFVFGASLLFGSISYFIIKDKNNYHFFCESKKLRLVYETLFFLFFSGSLLVLHIYEVRNVYYFTFISLSTALLALSIFVLDSQKKTFQILKICLLSLNLKYSIFYLHYGFTMPDAWRHAKLNSLISLTGHFTQFNNLDVLLDKELYFPLTHIYVAMSQVFFDVSIKEASNLTLIIPMVLSSICIYLFASKYFGEKVGLFSMLIMNITDFSTLWGSAPQTTTYGITLFSYLLYLYSKSTQPKHKSVFKALLILFIFSLIFGHAISSFIFFTTIVGLSVGSIIFKLIHKNKETSFFALNIILISLIGITQHWMIVEYQRNSDTFFQKITSLLYSAILEYSGFLNRPESVSSYVATLPPFAERFVDHFGLMTIVFFSIIGGLLLLSSKYQNKSNFPLIFCVSLLLSISLGFPIFGMNNIVPERWFIYEYFFLSIISAFGIIKISNLIYYPRLAKCFIVIIFFTVSFFMITSTVSNTDNPLWLKESTISNSFSINEVKGAETISKFTKNIYTDPSYFLNIFDLNIGIGINSPFREIVSKPDELIKSNFSTNVAKIYVWRRYTINRPINIIRESGNNYGIASERMEYTTKILGHDILEKLEKHNKIYDNRNTKAYYL